MFCGGKDLRCGMNEHPYHMCHCMNEMKVIVKIAYVACISLHYEMRVHCKECRQ